MGIDVMKAEVYCNEYMQVLVPENWKAFLGIDPEGNATPKKVHIYKDAESEYDIFHKAGITKSLGYPYIMLETNKKIDRILVMILTENGENKISFLDSDVQMIMKSIVVGKREGNTD